MSAWCCKYDQMLTNIQSKLDQGMTLQQADAAIIAESNVVPPPETLARPTSAYESKYNLAAFYYANCNCGG